MAKTSTERAAACHQKKLDAGLVKIPVWVPKHLADKLRAYAEKLRESET